MGNGKNYENSFKKGSKIIENKLFDSKDDDKESKEKRGRLIRKRLTKT
jgi:hypothetical protein